MSERLEIVGSCAYCGSPIYGPTFIMSEESDFKKRIKRSCDCGNDGLKFMDLLMGYRSDKVN